MNHFEFMQIKSCENLDIDNIISFLKSVSDDQLSLYLLHIIDKWDIWLNHTWDFQLQLQKHFKNKLLLILNCNKDKKLSFNLFDIPEISDNENWVDLIKDDKHIQAFLKYTALLSEVRDKKLKDILK